MIRDGRSSAIGERSGRSEHEIAGVGRGGADAARLAAGAERADAEGARIDRRDAGVGVRAAEGERAAAVLDERAGAGDDSGELGVGIVAAGDQGAGVQGDDTSRDAGERADRLICRNGAEIEGRAAASQIERRPRGQGIVPHHRSHRWEPFRIQVSFDRLAVVGAQHGVVDEHFADVAGPIAAAAGEVIPEAGVGIAGVAVGDEDCRSSRGPEAGRIGVEAAGAGDERVSVAAVGKIVAVAAAVGQSLPLAAGGQANAIVAAELAPDSGQISAAVRDVDDEHGLGVHGVAGIGQRGGCPIESHDRMAIEPVGNQGRGGIAVGDEIPIVAAQVVHGRDG